MIKSFNILTSIFIFILCFLFFYGVSYESLIDPVYYIDAAKNSVTISDAISHGERWSSDILFISISYIINKLSLSYDGNGVFYSLVIVSLMIMTLYDFVDKKFYLIVVSLAFLNLSLLAFSFNIWRQALSTLVIILSLGFRRNLFLFHLASIGFHFNTGAIFLVFYVFRKIEISVLVKRLPFILVSSLFLGYLIRHNISYFESGIGVYSKTNSSSPILRYILGLSNFVIVYLIFVFFKSKKQKGIVYQDDVFKYGFFTIIVGLFLVVYIPAASERFMHSYFAFVPVWIGFLMSHCNKLGAWIIFLYSFFYMLVNLFLINRSHVFSIIEYSSFY
ncbi:EpsG family protein [Enterovibrio norvegicus]|uniref:EpsG family protein n=1 Tax=Enterovibrio norvegicus TaxID=188144 RepID=UPI00389A8287